MYNEGFSFSADADHCDSFVESHMAGPPAVRIDQVLVRLVGIFTHFFGQTVGLEPGEKAKQGQLLDPAPRTARYQVNFLQGREYMAFSNQAKEAWLWW